MTTHSVASFDHDTSNDNDSILGLVPNLNTSVRPMPSLSLISPLMTYIRHPLPSPLSHRPPLLHSPSCRLSYFLHYSRCRPGRTRTVWDAATPLRMFLEGSWNAPPLSVTTGSHALTHTVDSSACIQADGATHSLTRGYFYPYVWSNPGHRRL